MGVRQSGQFGLFEVFNVSSRHYLQKMCLVLQGSEMGSIIYSFSLRQIGQLKISD